MKKQKLMFNFLLRKYNKYIAKLERFQLAGRNEHRQGVLRKHIARIQDKLYGLYNSINLRKVTGIAMITASMLMITPDADAQFSFEPAVYNPFNLVDVISAGYGSYYSAPTLEDIDGDGDLDMLAGGYYSGFSYYQDTSTSVGPHIPAFDAPVLNPFGISSSIYQAKPTLVDIDGDGDFDIITGTGDGNFYFFEDTSTSVGPHVPAFDAPVLNPFGLSDIGYTSIPDFVDIDGDGDLDMISGSGYSTQLHYFEDTSTSVGPHIPAFDAPVINPFGISPTYTVNPTFVDADGDGDFDIFAGSNYNGFNYYEDTSTSVGPHVPAFDAAVLNPFGLTAVNRSTPKFVDLNNDGYLDIISGETYGGFYYFESLSPKTWTGATNTDWATVSNWSPAILPDNTDIVLIPNGVTNYPIASSIIDVGLLTVESNASLIINSGMVLNETFTNNGTVTLKDGAYLDDFTNTNASYVGSITVETVAANGLGDDQRLISSAVNSPSFSEIADDLNGPWGAGAQGANGVAITVDDCNTPSLTMTSNYGNLFEFDESLVVSCPLDGWVVRSSGNLESGKGYSAYLTTGTTFDLTGTPNTGNVSIGVTNNLSGVTDGEGWNLVGNPYPSPIERDALINQGASDVQYFVTSGVYQGTYSPYLPTANIAIAQGIQLKADTGSIACQGAVGSVLSSFNANASTISSNMPNPFFFSDGLTGTSISDGGNDMYDGGNILNTDLGTSIPYTNGAVSTSAAFGGGEYFTNKIDNIFIMVADLVGVSTFEITGDNGADGGGVVEGETFSITEGCETYDVFIKQVHSTSDPSINHIMIVPTSPGLAHTFPTNTNNDLHTLTGLSGSSRIYYLLVAGSAGYDYTTTELQAIVSDFLSLADISGAALANTNLTFRNSMRTTAAATWYQNEAWFNHKLEVSVQGPQFADKTVLFYNNEATNGYEAMYDVVKRKSNAGKPTLSTTAVSKDLSLNGKSVDEIGEIVPMNLLPGENGSFTFSFEGEETFPSNTTIYVRDLQEDILHNVADGDYTFVSNTTDNADRFEIIFVPEVDFTTLKVDCDLNEGGLVLENLNNTANRTFEVIDNSTVINSGNLVDLNAINLEVGTYTLDVTDEYGGTQSYAFEILNAETIEANMDVSNTEIVIGEVITLNNTTTNSSNVVWTISNIEVSSVNNLTYSFDEAGTYEIEMMVSNGECSDTKSIIVEVLNKTTAIETVNGEEILLYPNPTSDVLNIEFSKEITVKIMDFLGRTILQTTEKSIDLNDFTSGVYFIEIYDENKQLIGSEKIIKK